MNIEIIKDQNKTEYDRKMQEYNASISEQKHKKQIKEERAKKEKEW